MLSLRLSETHTLEELQQRSAQTYEQMNRLLQATDLVGVSGRLRFTCPGYDPSKDD